MLLAMISQLAFTLAFPPAPPPDFNLSHDYASTLANEWMMAWNRHDVHDIVDTHYLDEHVELTSPIVFDITGKTKLQGKEALRTFVTIVLEMIPNLHFVLHDVLVGKDSVAIYYKSDNRRECAIMFVNMETGKVYKIVNHCHHCG
jgi:predicted ester cyclase